VAGDVGWRAGTTLPRARLEHRRTLWQGSSGERRESLRGHGSPQHVLLLVSLQCFNVFSATPVTAVKEGAICTLEDLTTFTLTTLAVINVWVTTVLHCFKIKKLRTTIVLLSSSGSA